MCNAMKYPAKLAANGAGRTPRTPITSATYAPKNTSLPANAVMINAVRPAGFDLYTRSVNTQVALTTTSGPSMPSHTSVPNQTPNRAADSTLPVASHKTAFNPRLAPYGLPWPQTVFASS